MTNVILMSQYLDSSVQNLYGNNQGGGRFGATIVNLGDINKDNIDDLAIGAPNEDEGAGAVYIFNGKSDRMNEVHSQRIAAKTSFNGIKSFRTYISRPLNIDKNKYAVWRDHLYRNRGKRCRIDYDEGFDLDDPELLRTPPHTSPLVMPSPEAVTTALLILGRPDTHNHTPRNKVKAKRLTEAEPNNSMIDRIKT
ncbi:integrin alpha-4, partial [Mytilus galloprovincialis]